MHTRDSPRDPAQGPRNRRSRCIAEFPRLLAIAAFAMPPDAPRIALPPLARLHAPRTASPRQMLRSDSPRSQYLLAAVGLLGQRWRRLLALHGLMQRADWGVLARCCLQYSALLAAALFASVLAYTVAFFAARSASNTLPIAPLGAPAGFTYRQGRSRGAPPGPSGLSVKRLESRLTKTRNIMGYVAFLPGIMGAEEILLVTERAFEFSLTGAPERRPKLQ